MESRITVQEAAAELGVTPRRVQALIKAGRLPASQFGRVWAIRRTDLSLVRDRTAGRPKKEAPKGTSAKRSRG